MPVVNTPPKRAYQKHDTAYWTGKTIKFKRRKVIKQRILRNACLLGRASKLASVIYRRLGLNKRYYYRQLVAKSMELLRDEWCEEDILAGLREEIFGDPLVKVEYLANKVYHTSAGIIEHPHGYHYFVTTLHKRFFAEFEPSFANFVANLGFRRLTVNCISS